MDPKEEIITAKEYEIEAILDEWGFTKGKPQRDHKKAQIKQWLSNFLPSEIDDAFLILSKIQVKDPKMIHDAIALLAKEIIAIFQNDLSKVKFFPLGMSPSSSGGMYLYDYQRELFLLEYNFPYSEFKDNLVGTQALVFFDDLIGSGKQAIKFADKNIKDLRVKSYYISIFAFEEGLQRVKKQACFEDVFCGCILSDEERAFHPRTAVFTDPKVRAKLKSLCKKYGEKLWPDHPLGYDDSQALLVFPHNTPNNTLPIIWANTENEKRTGIPWNPIFERKKKTIEPPKKRNKVAGLYDSRGKNTEVSGLQKLREAKIDLSTDQLWKIFYTFEKRLPTLTMSSEYIVKQATSEKELNDIKGLDVHKEGFLGPNQYGEDLTTLWKRDRAGFYVIYNSLGKPIGYCDLFGLNPDWHFIQSLLIDQCKGNFELPNPVDLADAIIPRTQWSDRSLEIYVDAVLLLKPYHGTEAAWRLLNYVCKDLQTYPGVRATRIATVVVDNEQKSAFSSEVADDPYKNSVQGAKLAIRSGLVWNTYKGIGHEEEMGLGRYLYVSDFGVIPLVKNWAICSASKFFKTVAKKWPDLDHRIPQIHEFLKRLV